MAFEVIRIVDAYENHELDPVADDAPDPTRNQN
jgi:hypothetical protein